MALILGQKSDDSSLVRALKETGQALHCFEQGLIAGEQNPESPAAGYLVVRGAWNKTRLTSLATHTVNSSPSIAKSLFFNAASTGIITISDGVTPIYVIPAAIAGGTLLDFDGVKFNTSLVVDLAAADDVVVNWAVL